MIERPKEGCHENIVFLMPMEREDPHAVLHSLF